MNTINGRTPEEIKNILECCYGNKEKRLCDRCPMGCKVEGYSEFICLDFDDAGENALAYIQQLERERDAAVEDMRKATLIGCHVCKHYYRPDSEVWKYACKIHGSFEEHDFISDDGSVFCGAFEWRGVQEGE